MKLKGENMNDGTADKIFTKLEVIQKDISELNKNSAVMATKYEFLHQEVVGGNGKEGLINKVKSNSDAISQIKIIGAGMGAAAGAAAGVVGAGLKSLLLG